MGAQSLESITLESKRQDYENKMIKKGEDYLLYKHYHLGEPADFHQLMHLRSLHRAHSSENCNVQNFIKKQLEPKHNYLNVKNERQCEEFDICYTNNN